MEDAQIVSLYWERNQDAITESDKKYGAYCYRIAHNMLQHPDDAHEMVNDTWLGAWDTMPPHRPAVLATFLGKITRRLSISRYRRYTAAKRGSTQTTLALEELEQCLAHTQDVESTMEHHLLVEQINLFLGSLSVTERRIFLRRYWYLDPIRTIAQDYDRSVSQITSLLHRLRGRLRAQLIQEGYLHER